MNKPIRIQRKRTKGWKMPENTVYVGRPTKWGNPYVDMKAAVNLYRELMNDILWHTPDFIVELKGKNLSCWCPIYENGEYCNCHADVLLSFANDLTLKEIQDENIKYWERQKNEMI